MFNKTLDFAKDNFTDIFLQVRRSADAFYNSKYEPRAKTLNGIDDLLGYACKNKGKLKVHAYLTVLQLWRENNANAGQFPDEWLMIDNTGIVYLNPCVKEVQDHIVNVCKDICKYDIDGLFLEKMRYSSKLLKSLGEKNNSTDEEKEEAITNLMRRIYTEVKKIKNIPISVCVKTADVNFNFSKQFTSCDWDSWIKEGIVDFAYPMLINKSFDHIETWSGIVEPNPKTIPILGCYCTLKELKKQKELFSDYIIYSLANFSKDKKDKVSLRSVND